MNGPFQSYGSAPLLLLSPSVSSSFDSSFGSLAARYYRWRFARSSLLLALSPVFFFFFLSFRFFCFSG